MQILVFGSVETTVRNWESCGQEWHLRQIFSFWVRLRVTYRFATRDVPGFFTHSWCFCLSFVSLYTDMAVRVSFRKAVTANWGMLTGYGRVWTRNRQFETPQFWPPNHHYLPNIPARACCKKRFIWAYLIQNQKRNTLGFHGAWAHRGPILGSQIR